MSELPEKCPVCGMDRYRPVIKSPANNIARGWYCGGVLRKSGRFSGCEYASSLAIEGKRLLRAAVEAGNQFDVSRDDWGAADEAWSAIVDKIEAHLGGEDAP